MPESMLRKKEVFTVITPIPSFIPRQLAIDILHSHSEVITLNPLVLEHKPIKAPRDAAADEYYSTWYEIIERIQYVPGLGRMGSGKISFNGCFHDMPWGLQTHIYAPMNIDLRNKYRIAGNQSGYEPPEPLEMGLAELGAPKDGLYLHEDIVITCNIAAMGFVKSQLKQAGKEMVQRIIKKAELLDAGVLHAMIENGKLKTVNPADRSDLERKDTLTPSLPSPTASYHNQTAQQHQQPPLSPRTPYHIPQRGSFHNSIHGHVGGGASGYPPQPYGYSHYHPGGPAELAVAQNPTAQSIPMELPGDYYHPQPSPRLQPPSQPSTPGHPPTPGLRDSTVSGLSGSHSRPASVSSNVSEPFRSPGLEHKGFASELPTHSEAREEQDNRKAHPAGPPAHQAQFAPYNPADYAKLGPQQMPHHGSYIGHQQQHQQQQQQQPQQQQQQRYNYAQ